jgi:hypothetical protein
MFLVGIILSLLAHPIPVASESVETQALLNKAFQDVQSAESSGASPDEIQGLLAQLNSVLQLQDELQSVPPQDTQMRTQLLGQIESNLSSVDQNAIQIATVASQRTSMNHVIAYSLGVAGAVLGTLAYYCVMLVFRKYRVKRTFGMRIIPKTPT